jgi:hypothetical protein
MDYPKFFEIDDELVVISEQEGDVVGLSVPHGRPYPPIKAMNQGEELTRAEFLEKLEELYPGTKLTSMF